MSTPFKWLYQNEALRCTAAATCVYSAGGAGLCSVVRNLEAVSDSEEVYQKHAWSSCQVVHFRARHYLKVRGTRRVKNRLLVQSTLTWPRLYKETPYTLGYFRKLESSQDAWLYVVMQADLQT